MNTTNIVDGGQVGEERAQITQLLIMGVSEPRGNRNSVIRVENVGCGRGVNDDSVLDRSPKL